MECSLLILDSDKQILPKKSSVSVEQADGQEYLLHKLGYSPTQYSLYLVPNSSLWAGVTQSSIAALVSSNQIVHENVGTLLFEHGRHFSLILAAKSEERDNVITKGEEYSTPKCDVIVRDGGESGYSTNHSSSITTPANDIIMMSSPPAPKESTECAKLNESCSTIIISDSEDEVEDPLVFNKAARTCALPGLFSHRLHSQPNNEMSSFQSTTSPYFLPPHPKHSSTGRAPTNTDTNHSNSRCSSLQPKQQQSSSRANKVIIISSSDEAELKLPPSPKSGGQHRDDIHRVRVQQTSGRSPQSSDEGIVLDSRWEGSSRTGYGGRVDDDKSVLETILLTEDDGSQHSVLSGDGQLLRQQKASEDSAVVKCCGYELTPADLRRLEPHQWLNDQIINCYMQLLMATYSRRHKVHIMSTFFYTKLTRSGYPGVERWLRRVDLKKLRLLLVPVHVSMCHWALAALNFRTKRIIYFDSLGVRNLSCLKRLKQFMRRCMKAQKYPYLHHWRLNCAKDIPHQQNGSDCGVFVCQFAKWLCSRPTSKSYSHIPFQQCDMPKFRKAMLDELKMGNTNLIH